MVRGDLAIQRVREPPRPTALPTWKSEPALPLPQVFDGNVAPPKSVAHDLKIGLKTIELSSVVIELSSVVAKAVGGPRAAEEHEEAMEHAQA
jgi:hypothetical protein